MISVVIPCRNEVKSIAETVRAILASTERDLEVLVVDGMSEDGTRDVLHQLTAEDPRVRTIDNPAKLTPFAFNLGVKNARGAYVQIVGSRNVLAPDYLTILKARLDAEPNVACVGGEYRHVYDSEAGRFISLAMQSKFGVGAGNYRTMSADAEVDTVGIPMYRASIFEEIGYFDERLTRNQDDDFNFRVRQRGHRIVFVHAAKATYLVRGSLKKAFQQFRQYGYFKVFVNKKHRAVTTVRQLVPAAFLAFLILGALATLAEGEVAVVYGAVLALYVGLGLKLAGRGIGWRERVGVLRTCFVLHCGYGLGYWQGIWDFLVCGRSPRGTLQRQTT